MRCLLPLFFVLSACTEFPELDAAISESAKQAPIPALLPLDQLLAGLPNAPIDTEIQDDLAARVAALRARASALRGPVIDQPTRSRLARGVQ